MRSTVQPCSGVLKVQSVFLLVSVLLLSSYAITSLYTYSCNHYTLLTMSCLGLSVTRIMLLCPFTHGTLWGTSSPSDLKPVCHVYCVYNMFYCVSTLVSVLMVSVDCRLSTMQWTLCLLVMDLCVPPNVSPSSGSLLSLFACACVVKDIIPFCC